MQDVVDIGDARSPGAGTNPFGGQINSSVGYETSETYTASEVAGT